MLGHVLGGQLVPKLIRRFLFRSLKGIQSIILFPSGSSTMQGATTLIFVCADILKHFCRMALHQCVGLSSGHIPSLYVPTWDGGKIWADLEFVCVDATHLCKLFWIHSKTFFSQSLFWAIEAFAIFGRSLTYYLRLACNSTSRPVLANIHTSSDEKGPLMSIHCIFVNIDFNMMY